jgi:hypothetical protein
MTGGNMSQSMLRKMMLAILLLCGVPYALGKDGASEELSPYAMGFDFSDTRFSLGIAAAALRYDTQLNFIDKESGNSVFADAEGTLGLPDSDVSPALFGRYRFSRRHALGFAYWNLKRSNTLISGDIDIGDIELSGAA